MDTQKIKGYLCTILKNVKDGLKIMNKCIVKKQVNSKTVVINAQTGKTISEKERERNVEYSLLKILCAVVFSAVWIVVSVMKLKECSKQKRIIKKQRQEIKKLEKTSE